MEPRCTQPPACIGASIVRKSLPCNGFAAASLKREVTFVHNGLPWRVTAVLAAPVVDCFFSQETMPVAVVLRRLLLITLLILPQVYWMRFAWRSSKRIRGIQGLIRLGVVGAVAGMFAVLYDAIATRFLPASLSQVIAPPVQLWMFSSTFAFYITKVLHGIVWCCTRVSIALRDGDRTPVHDASRRTVMRQAASVVGGMPFVPALYGYAQERFEFAVERVEVRIANLPPALDGMRIAQLSDIHAGDLMPLDEIRRAVAIANRLDPHLTVITGDFLTRAGDPLVECIRELSALRAPLGIWGCNGNHEIYADAEDETESLFAASGMRLLRQAAVPVEWNGAAFNLIGIDYQRNLPTDGSVMPTLNGAEHLVRRDMPNILLSHNPDTFPSAAAAGVELSLAGHTHGGQINFELLHTNINPARVLTRFIIGLYRLPLRDEPSQQACLYVNRGLGTLGLPARIGAKPEITLLTLRSSIAS